MNPNRAWIGHTIICPGFSSISLWLRDWNMKFRNRNNCYLHKPCPCFTYFLLSYKFDNKGIFEHFGDRFQIECNFLEVVTLAAGTQVILYRSRVYVILYRSGMCWTVSSFQSKYSLCTAHKSSPLVRTSTGSVFTMLTHHWIIFKNTTVA